MASRYEANLFDTNDFYIVFEDLMLKKRNWKKQERRRTHRRGIRLISGPFWVPNPLRNKRGFDQAWRSRVEVGRGTCLVAGTTIREGIVVTLIPVRVKNRTRRSEGAWVAIDSGESDVELHQIEDGTDAVLGRAQKMRERRFQLNSRGRRRLRRFHGSKPVAYRRVRASLMLYQSVPRSTLDRLNEEFGEEVIQLLMKEIEEERKNVGEPAMRVARRQRNAVRLAEFSSSSDDECVDDGGAFDRHMQDLRNRMVSRGYVNPRTPAEARLVRLPVTPVQEVNTQILASEDSILARMRARGRGSSN